MPAHIGTLAFAPTLKANASAKAKEPILPTHRLDFRKQIVSLHSNENIDIHISDFYSVTCC